MQLISALLFSMAAIAPAFGGDGAVMWRTGYFAPYLLNIGGTAGLSIGLKDWVGNTDKRPGDHRIQLLTQLNYFTQLNVSNHLLINPEIEYRWNKTGKRIFLSTSIGAGYMLSFLRKEGKLNLATGEIDYRHEASSHFVPNLNFGLGLEPRKVIGCFLKATYGFKWGTSDASEGFVGLSSGIIIKPKNKRRGR